MVAIALAVSLLGCPREDREDEVMLSPDARLRELPLNDDDALLGVSGLALRAPNEVWLAPERTGALVATTIGEREGWGPLRFAVLEGLPPGLDVEALAFIDGEHVLLGTEAKVRRAVDPVFLARLDEGRATITGALDFDYRAFGIQAEDNQGVEGLCVVADHVLAASEVVIEDDGERYAVVQRIALPEGKMTPYRVHLHSARGKLSALACRPGAHGIEVYAIERHFGVMRLVRFEIGSAPTVEANLVTDLTRLFEQPPPNLEGLEWIADDVLLAVSDNHYGRKDGPPRAVAIELPPRSTVLAP